MTLLTGLYIWCYWFVYQPKKNKVFAGILLIGAAMWSIVLAEGDVR